MTDKKQRPARSRSDASAVVFDLTYARHDPAHVLAPGLFRSLGPNDRKRLKLDVTYVHGEDALQFTGFEPLGVDDLRILQGLVAMAGKDGLWLKDEGDPSESARQLMLDLFTPPHELVLAGQKPDTLVVRNSFRRLAREIGMAESGQSIKIIRKSIERLFGVTIFVQTGKKRFATRLLSSYASDEGTGDLFVALNPRVTAAIMGDTQYIRIDLDEVRGLKTDPARLIHQRLCGWIDMGRTAKVRIETLAEYAWPVAALTESTVRKRRAKVRDAMQELRDIGWTVTEGKDGVCEIMRPRMIEG